MAGTGVLALRQRMTVVGTLHLIPETGSQPVCGVTPARWSEMPPWPPGSPCGHCRRWARRAEQRGDVRLILPSGWLEQDGS